MPQVARRLSLSLTVALLAFAAAAGLLQAADSGGPQLGDVAKAGPVTPYPILFVTQPPLARDFATVNATFGSHLAGLQVATRGGDLWIRYPDGTLKNLTAAAGYGVDGFQGLSSIAVRDPSVHWDGTKAIFAMAVGSVERRYELRSWLWQLYEVSGLGAAEAPVITKLPNQPATYNNVMPVYAADDRVLFVSDRPRAGAAHLHPQLDEYERTPTNSGIWSLHPATGDLRHIDHAPSGDFDPMVDSFGRLIFTRWDHLERDQLADADAGPVSSCFGGTSYGSFNYSDETAGATITADLREDYPEPRRCRNDLLVGTRLDGHAFNHFLPWMAHQDGSELETLNHVGRHELHGYLGRTFNDDPNVVEYYGQYARTNPRSLSNLFQIAESPVDPGRFYGIDAPEFGTHASGQIVSLSGGPATNPDDMLVSYLTHRVTSSTSEAPPPEHIGLARDPLVLSNGVLVAAHTAETRQDRNEGSTEAPLSRYKFRLKTFVPGPGGYMVPGELLTPGISKSVSWWDPDTFVSMSGELWELGAVEVRSRPRVASPPPALEDPEAGAFAAAGVDLGAFRAYLAERDLALIVSRDVTTRDDQDRQQPRNLRVPDGVETLGGAGRVYDVTYMQLFQADQLRGQTGCCSSDPLPGRRVLARPLHDAAALACDPSSADGPEGSKRIEADGSMAAIVPARRALTWQLTDEAGEGVVRERFWLTFQPGEVRVCTSCHGINKLDQAGEAAPENQPLALVKLLEAWAECSGGSSARRRGDCNADGLVDSGDVQSVVREIVDPLFAGDAIGCDANGDARVDAGDIPCAARLIARGAGACLPATPAAEKPLLTLPLRVGAPAGGRAVLPLRFHTRGNAVAGLTLTIDYDETWLSFDPSDADADGLPDAIRLSLPPGFEASVRHDATALSGELRIVISDPAEPLASLPDGALAYLSFDVGAAPDGTEIGVRFGSAPASSFGATGGASLPGASTPGSVLVGGPTNEPATITWRNRVSGVNVRWEMDGPLIASSQVLPPVTDVGWRMAAVVDLDRDGKLDILWRHATTGANAIWYMVDGAIVGSAMLPAVADPGWQIVGAADFDGDAEVDIVWRHATSGSNVIWYLRGSAIKGYATLPPVADVGWRIVAVVDFDADGQADLVWRHRSAGVNVIWYMAGTSVKGYASLPAVADTSWQIAGVVDFDRDGQRDVVWRHERSGVDVVWYMNGTSIVGYALLPPVTDTTWSITGVH